MVLVGLAGCSRPAIKTHPIRGTLVLAGGDVKLLKLTSKTKDLLQMTKLLTVFDTYDDEAKAIASLKGQK